MSYYRHHVFFCCNKRDPPEACCANHDAAEMQAYAKQKVKELGLNGKGSVRINKAGCLDRCEEGPGTPKSIGTTSTKSSTRTWCTDKSSKG